MDYKTKTAKKSHILIKFNSNPHFRSLTLSSRRGMGRGRGGGFCIKKGKPQGLGNFNPGVDVGLVFCVGRV
jgi:hypothetical protein